MIQKEFDVPSEPASLKSVLQIINEVRERAQGVGRHPGGRGEEKERLKIGRGKKEVQNAPARSFSEPNCFTKELLR